MTPGIRIVLGIAYLGVYLFLLGWNVFASAASFTRRTRLHRFPFDRCLIAAAGPTTVPVIMMLVLPLWGWGSDAVMMAFASSWALSFWATAIIERKLPESKTTGHERGEPGRESLQGNTPADLTTHQSYMLMIAGVMKAWLALAIGGVMGYGVAAVVSRVMAIPFQPPTWARLAASGPARVMILYGMLGVLIEALRFQEDPGDANASERWEAASQLRLRLLACLVGAATCVGFYAGLYW